MFSVATNSINVDNLPAAYREFNLGTLALEKKDYFNAALHFCRANELWYSCEASLSSIHKMPIPLYQSFGIALMFDIGYEVKTDFESAIIWYKKVIDDGKNSRFAEEVPGPSIFYCNINLGVI